MARSTRVVATIARFVAAAFAAACCVALGFAVACGSGSSSHEVGQRCTPDLDGGVQPLYEPAPECPSNICANIPVGGGTCTARCDTAEDCVGEQDAGCQGGFLCTVATVSGPVCCLGFCYCRDDFWVIPDGGIPMPLACDPNDEQNTCCNLPGRDPCEE